MLRKGETEAWVSGTHRARQDEGLERRFSARSSGRGYTDVEVGFGPDIDRDGRAPCALACAHERPHGCEEAGVYCV
jgi:hypothetical protein